MELGQDFAKDLISHTNVDPLQPAQSCSSQQTLRQRLKSFRNPPKMSNAELANSYAALILADDGIEITVSH